MATSLRAAVVDALTAALPGDEWKIIGYADMPERVERRTVAVWASAIQPSERLKKGQYAVTVQLEIATPHQDIAKADDDLDDALLAVLPVLFELGVAFERAERTTNEAKTQHAWNVTVSQILIVTPESPED